MINKNEKLFLEDFYESIENYRVILSDICESEVRENRMSEMTSVYFMELMKFRALILMRMSHLDGKMPNFIQRIRDVE